MSLAAEIICCLLMADFITGLMHWIEDTYAVKTWPVLRETVVLPNIEHHKEPGRLVTTSFWYRNKENMAVVGIITVVAWLLWPFWQVAAVGALTAFGNEVHAWSHKRPRWTVLRCLQDMGILQHPKQHAEHHRQPYNRRYCVLTNFVNPILDTARFWRGLELLLAGFGLQVKRGTEGRDFV